ncbi:MAG: EAL domain-containing protein [Gemmatimonadaceae bacterium]|nr:EAL domain-containing protein [Gemmatimonadaceae bacterium]
MPLSSFLNVAGLTLQAGAALLIAAVFSGLHRRYWRPFLRHWTWSWLALAAHAAGGAGALLLATVRPINDPVRFTLALVAGVAGYLQIVWLLLGTAELTTGSSLPRRTARWILASVVVAAVLLVGAFAWDPSREDLIFLLRVTVRRAAVGLAFVAGGVAIRRVPRVGGAIGRRMVMLAFFGLGAQQLHFMLVSLTAPLRSSFAAYSASLAFVDVVLYFALAMGLVIWLLEEERQATMDAAAKIERIAYHDALTGLPNRQLFSNQLGMALHRARRNSTMSAVLFLDLDRFKVVNDSLGHAAGDVLLQTVAERIRSAVRGEDSVTRLGGDEFAVLAAEVADADHAIMLAERIIAEVKRPIVVEGQEVFVTTSLGIAMYPNDGTEAETLLKNADAAMYRAKGQGRDVVERYFPELGAASAAQLGLESNLQRAIENDQLHVYYQPIVSVSTGEITGVEALLRWNHPERGLLGPAEFITLAEATGAIVPMGEWVLRTACTQVQKWRERGLELRAAVNLSVRQLQHAELVQRVDRILEDSGLPASSLELEITESIAMRSSGRAIDNLRALKARGVRVSIDDLGTGYSSLSALRLFPIDSLKIDRSFVQGVPHNMDDSAIAAAVIALGMTLGVNVIAEGIERPEQLAFFTEQRCAEWQGYLLVRPVTAELCEELLFEGSTARAADSEVLAQR